MRKLSAEQLAAADRVRVLLPSDWTTKHLKETLAVNYGEACMHVRCWLYAGLIEKLPQKTGGYQRFRFRLPFGK
jgi:hypothetical protein